MSSQVDRMMAFLLYLEKYSGGPDGNPETWWDDFKRWSVPNGWDEAKQLAALGFFVSEYAQL